MVYSEVCARNPSNNQPPEIILKKHSPPLHPTQVSLSLPPSTAASNVKEESAQTRQLVSWASHSPAQAVRVRHAHVPVRVGLILRRLEVGHKRDRNRNSVHRPTVRGTPKSPKAVELNRAVADSIAANGIRPDGVDERVVEVRVDVVGIREAAALKSRRKSSLL